MILSALEIAHKLYPDASRLKAFGEIQSGTAFPVNRHSGNIRKQPLSDRGDFKPSVLLCEIQDAFAATNGIALLDCSQEAA